MRTPRSRENRDGTTVAVGWMKYASGARGGESATAGTAGLTPFRPTVVRSTCHPNRISHRGHRGHGGKAPGFLRVPCDLCESRSVLGIDERTITWEKLCRVSPEGRRSLDC